jgi:hypothetical protein
MSKRGLNTHVFGQNIYNWLPLPAETGQMIEIPIPPVSGMSEVLVYVSASFDGIGEGDHHYAVYTRSNDVPVPFHYLFGVCSASKTASGCNSDNFWVRMPDEGLPRVVIIQKMSGAPLPAGPNFRSGAVFLNLR